jgi:hypothetical protein
MTDKVVMPLDAHTIVGVLQKKHDPRQWAFFDELRIGTGYGKDSEQRMDAWAIHYFPSKRNVVRCYEIKISRNDFFSEIKKPLKRRAGLRLSNEFYFVVPAGLVQAEEVPLECGLMEVVEKDGKYIVNTVVPAPFRDVMPPTWLFLASICRRVDRFRLTSWFDSMHKDIENKMYGIAVVDALQRHIDRWANWKDGSKEVPDRIAAALKDLKYEVFEIIRNNKESE